MRFLSTFNQRITLTDRVTRNDSNESFAGATDSSFSTDRKQFLSTLASIDGSIGSRSYSGRGSPNGC